MKKIILMSNFIFGHSRLRGYTVVYDCRSHGLGSLNISIEIELTVFCGKRNYINLQ
jgi:hypothetical protein